MTLPIYVNAIHTNAKLSSYVYSLATNIANKGLICNRLYENRPCSCLVVIRETLV